LNFSSISGIRNNIYTYLPEFDPSEFILLAVQHYYILHGKDVEPDKMKQIIEDTLPPPYTSSMASENSRANRTKKPLLSEKDIDGMVQNAIRTDVEVILRRSMSTCVFMFLSISFVFVKFKRLIKRLKQKFKKRDDIKREIKKDVIGYAQTKWPIVFSRIFPIQMLSGPLIDEIATAKVSIGKDRIRFTDDDISIIFSEINFSEVTEIMNEQ
jgi:tmRNA-binding protein